MYYISSLLHNINDCCLLYDVSSLLHDINDCLDKYISSLLHNINYCCLLNDISSLLHDINDCCLQYDISSLLHDINDWWWLLSPALPALCFSPEARQIGMSHVIAGTTVRVTCYCWDHCADKLFFSRRKRLSYKHLAPEGLKQARHFIAGHCSLLSLLNIA